MSKERLSELTEKQQENKKEDKKAFKKFIWILAASFLVGAGSGAGGVIVGNLLNDSAAKEKIITLLRYPAIYGGYFKLSTLIGLPLIKRRKVGMTSNHHALYDLGYTRTTMALKQREATSRGEAEPKKVSQFRL